MCLAVVLLFFAYVIGEIASIVILGGFVGAMYTVLVLAAAAVLGSFLLMGRAAATLRAAAEAMAKREPVGELVAASALGAFAGVLLISPGLLSDALAVILLLPPTRARLAGRMAAGLRGRAQVLVAQVRGHGHGPGASAPPPVDAAGVIDVDGVETRAAADDDDRAP